MSEQPVVWIGKKPKSMETRKTPVEPAELEALLSAAAGSCGFSYRNHVFAEGEYGSWLVHLDKEECRHRVVWNGKEETMVLEQATGPSGWKELASADCKDADTEKLVAELQTLLEKVEV